jgi:hypothetical protein
LVPPPVPVLVVFFGGGSLGAPPSEPIGFFQLLWRVSPTDDDTPVWMLVFDENRGVDMLVLPLTMRASADVAMAVSAISAPPRVVDNFMAETPGRRISPARWFLAGVRRFRIRPIHCIAGAG